MPDSPATALLSEALAFLDLIRVEVGLEPIAGTWQLVLAGVAVTTGDLVARAIGLGMLGGRTPLQ